MRDAGPHLTAGTRSVRWLRVPIPSWAPFVLLSWTPSGFHSCLTPWGPLAELPPVSRGVASFSWAAFPSGPAWRSPDPRPRGSCLLCPPACLWSVRACPPKLRTAGAGSFLRPLSPQTSSCPGERSRRKPGSPALCRLPSAEGLLSFRRWSRGWDVPRPRRPRALSIITAASAAWRDTPFACRGFLGFS